MIRLFKIIGRARNEQPLTTYGENASQAIDTLRSYLNTPPETHPGYFLTDAELAARDKEVAERAWNDALDSIHCFSRDCDCTRPIFNDYWNSEEQKKANAQKA